MTIIFFGSTSDSVIVADALHKVYPIACVVTQPPKPVGRKQEITPTPVELWAKKHTIPVLSFPGDEEKPWLYLHEEDVINALATWKPDLLVSACYGQKIPTDTIKHAPFGGLNIHPSLLPRWRGADPIPWTILTDDRQTGVTLVTVLENFDEGNIIAQKKIAITDQDLPDPLRTHLFTMGATLLLQELPDYLSGKNNGTPQNQAHMTYARKLNRADGFIPWELLMAGIEGTDIPQKHTDILTNIPGPLSNAIIHMIRALSPWPGVWTIIKSKDEGLKMKGEEKRVKIIAAHSEKEILIIDTVQLEGKNPVPWKQFADAYIH